MERSHIKNNVCAFLLRNIIIAIRVIYKDKNSEIAGYTGQREKGKLKTHLNGNEN